MTRRQFQWRGRRSNVVLDYCRDHGVWLDGDELPRVADFVVRAAQQGVEPVETRPAIRLADVPAVTRRAPQGPFELLVRWIEGLGDLLGS